MSSYCRGRAMSITSEQVYGCVCMDVCVYGCVYVWVCVCMGVCVRVCVNRCGCVCVCGVLTQFTEPHRRGSKVTWTHVVVPHTKRHRPGGERVFNDQSNTLKTARTSSQ